jgi:hypothetical protein
MLSEANTDDFVFTFFRIPRERAGAAKPCIIGRKQRVPCYLDIRVSVRWNSLEQVQSAATYSTVQMDGRSVLQ